MGGRVVTDRIVGEVDMNGVIDIGVLVEELFPFLHPMANAKNKIPQNMITAATLVELHWIRHLIPTHFLIQAP